ncbi:hypothetical protein TRFO_29369 [Tritrichomonas foetus]|uniref:RING-type domain-containing protein n=1 Tax=Tritrichomonas foetus TaxID=1144522 RepID=A0A1J4K0K0_9EUKA|nr:hypothetical protein TRFO_29369 [Tritrichomonas foetus]|eukprot:OHT03278.1 hypothetical protein TRFO_29369 [Tritrichomonas foetus]
MLSSTDDEYLNLSSEDAINQNFNLKKINIDDDSKARLKYFSPLFVQASGNITFTASANEIFVFRRENINEIYKSYSVEVKGFINITAIHISDDCIVFGASDGKIYFIDNDELFKSLQKYQMQEFTGLTDFPIASITRKNSSKKNGKSPSSFRFFMKDYSNQETILVEIENKKMKKLWPNDHSFQKTSFHILVGQEMLYPYSTKEICAKICAKYPNIDPNGFELCKKLFATKSKEVTVFKNIYEKVDPEFNRPIIFEVFRRKPISILYKQNQQSIFENVISHWEKNILKIEDPNEFLKNNFNNPQNKYLNTIDEFTLYLSDIQLPTKFQNKFLEKKKSLYFPLQCHILVDYHNNLLEPLKVIQNNHNSIFYTLYGLSYIRKILEHDNKDNDKSELAINFNEKQLIELSFYFNVDLKKENNISEFLLFRKIPIKSQISLSTKLEFIEKILDESSHESILNGLKSCQTKKITISAFKMLSKICISILQFISTSKENVKPSKINKIKDKIYHLAESPLFLTGQEFPYSYISFFIQDLITFHFHGNQTIDEFWIKPLFLKFALFGQPFFSFPSARQSKKRLIESFLAKINKPNQHGIKGKNTINYSNELMKFFPYSGYYLIKDPYQNQEVLIDIFDDSLKEYLHTFKDKNSRSFGDICDLFFADQYSIIPFIIYQEILLNENNASNEESNSVVLDTIINDSTNGDLNSSINNNRKSITNADIHVSPNPEIKGCWVSALFEERVKKYYFHRLLFDSIQNRQISYDKMYHQIFKFTNLPIFTMDDSKDNQKYSKLREIFHFYFLHFVIHQIISTINGLKTNRTHDNTTDENVNAIIDSRELYLKYMEYTIKFTENEYRDQVIYSMITREEIKNRPHIERIQNLNSPENINICERMIEYCDSYQLMKSSVCLYKEKYPSEEINLQVILLVNNYFNKELGLLNTVKSQKAYEILQIIINNLKEYKNKQLGVRSVKLNQLCKKILLSFLQPLTEEKGQEYEKEKVTETVVGLFDIFAKAAIELIAPKKAVRVIMKILSQSKNNQQSKIIILSLYNYIENRRSLQDNAFNVYNSDHINLTKDIYIKKNVSHLISPHENVCSNCKEPIYDLNNLHLQHKYIQYFHCGHSFHIAKCCEKPKYGRAPYLNCPICQQCQLRPLLESEKIQKDIQTLDNYYSKYAHKYQSINDSISNSKKILRNISSINRRLMPFEPCFQSIHNNSNSIHVKDIQNLFVEDEPISISQYAKTNK